MATPPAAGGVPARRPRRAGLASADLHRQARRHAACRSRSSTGSTIASSRRGTTSRTPNLIRVGQVLRLVAAGRDAAGGRGGRPPASTTAPLRTRAAGASRCARRRRAAPAGRRRRGTASLAGRPRNTDSAEGLAEGGQGALYARARARDGEAAGASRAIARATGEACAAAVGACADARRAAVVRRATRRDRRRSPPPSRRRSARAVAGDDDGPRLGVAGEGQARRAGSRRRRTSRASTSRARRASRSSRARRAASSTPGTGLRGYGKLVIIKHNNTYLSAYAHNRDILVKEGQQVTRGQKIAEMGSTDADR